jgi:hypothetical protein
VLSMVIVWFRSIWLRDGCVSFFVGRDADGAGEVAGVQAVKELRDVIAALHQELALRSRT